METIIDQISLPKFKVARWTKVGGIYGLVLTRKLTFEEANYIFKNILMFASDYLIAEIKADEDPEELEDYKNEIVEDITKFVKGYNNMEDLLDIYAPECSGEGCNIWNVIDIIQYLVSIDAIEYES